MKRELGIARCGLACCLCAQNDHCPGCNSEESPGKEWCENLHCSMEHKLDHCYACKEDCHKGLLAKEKAYGFTQFIKRYGVEHLLERLEANEKAGIIYHRTNITGDYDGFEDVEELIHFIETGKRRKN